MNGFTYIFVIVLQHIKRDLDYVCIYFMARFISSFSIIVELLIYLFATGFEPAIL